MVDDIFFRQRPAEGRYLFPVRIVDRIYDGVDLVLCIIRGRRYDDIVISFIGNHFVSAVECFLADIHGRSSAILQRVSLRVYGKLLKLWFWKYHGRAQLRSIDSAGVADDAFPRFLLICPENTKCWTLPFPIHLNDEELQAA